MHPKRRHKKSRQPRREIQQAWKAVERGDLERAVKEMERALAETDESPAVWTDYGRILTLSGRLGDAEKALRNAVRIGPWYAEAYVELATVLARKGLTIQAFRTQSRAVELKPQVGLYRQLLKTYEAQLPEDYGRDTTPEDTPEDGPAEEATAANTDTTLAETEGAPPTKNEPQTEG